MNKTNLIVGCGLSGAVLAERLASQGEEVILLDRRNHIGGNIYDYKDVQTGITVHQYGPHVFHTKNKQVWEYLSRFTEWHRFMYRVKAVLDGIEVNIPFNFDSIQKVFPHTLADKLEQKLLEKFSFNAKIPIMELRQTQDPDLDFLAQYIYEKVFLGYTVKQWGVKPEELDPTVSGRVPILISRDSRYFQDQYQAIPAQGYTKMVENILKNPLIHIHLNTDFQKVKKDIAHDRLIYTGAIDEFFDYELGRLPYRSLEFVFKIHNCEYFQSAPQVNFPENYDYTRSVEYKYYLNEQADKTIVSYEYPCDFAEGQNERYYPIISPENKRLYTAYLEKAKSLSNVYFIGRLGDYQYYNMDETVARALNLAIELTGK